MSLTSPSKIKDGRIRPSSSYIFKMARDNRDDKKRQLWAEVIASFIGEKLEIKIQEAFPAIYLINREEVIGVLSPSFLEEKDALIHYMDILEKIGELEDKKNGRPHVVSHIFKHVESYLSEDKIFFEKDNFRKSIIEMFFFDSLIGNGDRHPQNWGIICSYEKSSSGTVEFLSKISPLYDHGNALSMDVLEEKLDDHLKDKNKREKIIRKGKYHASWGRESAGKDTNHIDMCKLLWENYPDMRYIMKDFIDRTENILPEIENFMLTECAPCKLPEGYEFSENVLGL